jgi:NAD(P)H dehydrogenase (quinone)
MSPLEEFVRPLPYKAAVPPVGNGWATRHPEKAVAPCLAALATAPPTTRHHEITGPEAIDVARLAAIAEQEQRTPVEYVPITPDEYAAELRIAGEDPWVDLRLLDHVRLHP